MLGFAAIAELPLAALPVLGTGAVTPLDVRTFAQPRRKNLPVFKSLADLERERKARDAQERPSAPVEKPEVARERPAPHPLLRALVQRIELPEVSGDKVALRETPVLDTLLSDIAQSEVARRSSKANEETASAERAAHERRKSEQEAERQRRRFARVLVTKDGRILHRSEVSRLAIARAMYLTYLRLSDRAAALLATVGEGPRLRRAIAAARRARGAYEAAIAGDAVLADLVQRGEHEQRFERLRSELHDWASSELRRVQSESAENGRKASAETKKSIENLLAAVSAVSILDDTD